MPRPYDYNEGDDEALRKRAAVLEREEQLRHTVLRLAISDMVGRDCSPGCVNDPTWVHWWPHPGPLNENQKQVLLEMRVDPTKRRQITEN